MGQADELHHHNDAEITPGPARCEAVNRNQKPCQRPAVEGQSRCNYHAGGLGAPAGNQNARKHGFYSKYAPASVKERFIEAGQFAGLGEECDLVRVMIDRAFAEGKDLLTICKGVEIYVRARRTEYLMGARSKESLTEAIAEVLERVGLQMGVPEVPRQ